MRLNIGSYSRIIAFALVALNPKLIGINAQVTNDSFVILFSTLSIFTLWVYIRSPSLKTALGIAVFAALAGITKGSGLVLFIGVTVILAANLIGAWKGKQGIKARALSIALVVVLFTVTAGIFGPYYSNYKTLGSPTAINIEKQPRAHFFEKTYVERPGVVSIFDSYFTFRLIDMLKRPHVTNDTAPTTLHRTSFWSQLYGRAHSVHFDYWPLRWQSDNSLVINTGRVILVLALVPTFVALTGFVTATKNSLVKLYSDGLPYFSRENDWIFSAFALVFLAMLLKITFDYREFATMKAIYIFPMLICVVKFIADGYEYLNKVVSKGISRFIWLSLVFLTVFYTVDIVLLVGHLA